MAELTWQKSTFSGSGQNDCLEIAEDAGTLHLRESDDPETLLTPDPRALRALFGRLKGEGAGGGLA